MILNKHIKRLFFYVIELSQYFIIMSLSWFHHHVIDVNFEHNILILSFFFCLNHYCSFLVKIYDFNQQEENFLFEVNKVASSQSCSQFTHKKQLSSWIIHKKQFSLQIAHKKQFSLQIVHKKQFSIQFVCKKQSSFSFIQKKQLSFQFTCKKQFSFLFTWKKQLSSQFACKCYERIKTEQGWSSNQFASGLTQIWLRYDSDMTQHSFSFPTLFSFTNILFIYITFFSCHKHIPFRPSAVSEHYINRSFCINLLLYS